MPKAKPINRDDLDRFHSIGIHIPSRAIALFGEINESSTNQFIKNLHVLEATPGDIHILLNTEGGDQAQGMSIYDSIKNSSRKIIITVIGEAYSMGAIILQAAHHRRILSHASVMFHYGTISQEGTSLKELKATWQFSERYSAKLDDIIYKLINASPVWNNTLTRDKYRSLNDGSTYLLGIEAVEWGLADELVKSIND